MILYRNFIACNIFSVEIGPKKEEVAKIEQKEMKVVGPEPKLPGNNAGTGDVDDLMPDPYQYVAIMGAG
jgi:hypothetical protein